MLHRVNAVGIVGLFECLTSPNKAGNCMPELSVRSTSCWSLASVPSSSLPGLLKLPALL